MAMAAPARQRVDGFGNVDVETSPLENRNDRGCRFDVLVAASAWHRVDLSIGWQRDASEQHDRSSPERLSGDGFRPRRRSSDRRPPRTARPAAKARRPPSGYSDAIRSLPGTPYLSR
jgi:hypothetical protein